MFLVYNNNTTTKKGLKMKLNYKVLALAPLFGLTMNSCKTLYTTNFVKAYNNKVLVKYPDTNEEYLLDCSKSNQDIKQMLSDLPYFIEGDPIQIETTKKHFNRNRILKAEDLKSISYEADTMRVRNHKQQIEALKQNQR